MKNTAFGRCFFICAKLLHRLDFKAPGLNARQTTRRLFVLFRFFEITLNPMTLPTLIRSETRVLKRFNPRFFLH
jgi:hypothetical protein